MERLSNALAKQKPKLNCETFLIFWQITDSRLESCQFSNGPDNIPTLGQYFFFKLWLVSAEGVQSGHAPHRSVQVVKQFIGDARSNLRSVAPGTHIFVSNDDPVCLRHGADYGFPIVRRQRSEV